MRRFSVGFPPSSDLIARLTEETLAPEDTALLSQAPTEIDFVRTALENTTAISYEKIRDPWKQRSLQTCEPRPT